MAVEKQESGASPVMGLSSLGTPSDHHFFLSHRVCGLPLQENDSHLVSSGLHSGASGARRGGLRHSKLALAAADGVPAHLPLPAVLLVTFPLPETRWLARSA